MATIDDLLARVDSKYTLVHFAAMRAREINNYYHSLGEGMGQYVRPLVEQVDSNKPLSIAMEEIAQDKLIIERPEEVRARALQAMRDEAEGDETGTDDADADVVTLPQGDDAILSDDDEPTDISDS
jgi:DNA-directed RNA polymerase subunit omega